MIDYVSMYFGFICGVIATGLLIRHYYLKGIEESRYENCCIELELPVETPRKYRKLCKQLSSDICFNKDDTFSIKYNFSIDYFGRTAERFSIILELAEAGYLHKADFKTLNQDICLIKELVERIEDIRIKGMMK